MNTSARYWKIWRINPAAENLGYNKITVTTAQEFINSQFIDIENSNFQNCLLSLFYGKNSQTDTINRARAGLCLRCYISEAILRECKKIDYLFSGEKQFNYRDLLPFVLNDDGEKLILLDEDGKTQLIVDEDFKIKESKYNLFSVKVLQTFNADLQSRMSLDNWAYLQIKQNHELKNFLSEFGLKHLSDWAILNRATTKQIERLLVQQRYIIEAYHAVYRRDRQQQRVFGVRRCPDPTEAQLQEMLVYLQQHQILVHNSSLLLKELNHIALELRRYDIWSSRECLDIYDIQNDTYIPRQDLYANNFDEVDIEEQEFLQFLREYLDSTLTEAIKQEIAANIQELQKSKKYASFAPKYLRGLELYYCESMSLTKITPILGMTSWNQARRILNPGELLLQVRAITVDRMLENILKLAQEKGLTNIPPEAEYLKTLTKQVESYADKEIFQEATEEIRAGRSRTMNSPYAKAIRRYIQK